MVELCDMVGLCDAEKVDPSKKDVGMFQALKTTPPCGRECDFLILSQSRISMFLDFGNSFGSSENRTSILKIILSRDTIFIFGIDVAQFVQIRVANEYAFATLLDTAVPGDAVGTEPTGAKIAAAATPHVSITMRESATLRWVPSTRRTTHV